MRQKQPDGSFSVQDGGEIDIRAAYCGLACASILNIIDEKLCKNTLLWLSRCQTYQGMCQVYIVCFQCTFSIFFVHKHGMLMSIVYFL